MMTSLKKKPKPFSAMSKVLCTGVQCRRFMVLTSLILVLLGCFALYSAMQNEEWTTDEPSQRRVFFIAFLLLVTSTGLCYYALQGDLEEDKEKMEAEQLKSVKHSDYNSINKSLLILSPAERQTTDKIYEQKFLQLLEPTNEIKINQTKEKSNKQYKNIKRAKSPVIYNVDELKIHNCINQNSQKKNIDKTVHKDSQEIKCNNKVSSFNEVQQSKSQSLLVQLMPLLPLQLAEKELARIKEQQNDDSTILTTRSNITLPQKRTQPNLPCSFAPNQENADAG